MAPESRPLASIISDELSAPVPPEATHMARTLCEDWGAGVSAILFYGSCLRTSDLDNKILDFYVLVDTYAAFHKSRIKRWLNAAFPPNVYYRQTRLGDMDVRAKVAVLALSQFEAAARGQTVLPAIWARFSQPCRLLHARDATVQERVVAAVARAAETFVRETSAVLKEGWTSEQLWTEGLALTYRTELRTERPGRSKEIYEADKARYDAVTVAVGKTVPTSRIRANLKWAWWRLAGKLYSVLRLIKAAFTFSGGPDYICWKIRQHSGVEITLTPWQRRHPILASTVLFWKLHRRGAIR